MDTISAEDVNKQIRVEHNKKIQDLKAQGLVVIAGRLFK